MVQLINGRPARILTPAQEAELEHLTDARRAALGRVLSAFVTQQCDPSDQHALDLHEAEQTYLALAIQTREMLNGAEASPPKSSSHPPASGC